MEKEPHTLLFSVLLLATVGSVFSSNVMVKKATLFCLLPCHQVCLTNVWMYQLNEGNIPTAMRAPVKMGTL